MKKTSIFLCVLCLLSMQVSKLGANGEELNNFAVQINNSSQSMVVMDKNSGIILSAKNPHMRLGNASTTKILTALTALKYANDLDEKHRIPKSAVGVEGSSIYLKYGDEFTLRELLYGLMLRSGNDAAVAIAIIVGRSMDNFVGLMNLTAKSCGAFNSNFTNPHGLSEKNHYTTASDLAKITAVALKVPVFQEIVKTKEYHSDNVYFANKNKMLRLIPNATGVKTGYTVADGKCLVSSAKEGDMELVCVVLNCPNMWEDSMNLLTKSFSAFEGRLIEKKGVMGSLPSAYVPFLRIKYGLKNDVVLPVPNGEEVRFELSLPNNVENKKHGSEIGEIKFYVQNRLLFSEKLYTLSIGSLIELAS